MLFLLFSVNSARQGRELTRRPTRRVSTLKKWEGGGVPGDNMGEAEAEGISNFGKTEQ